MPTLTLTERIDAPPPRVFELFTDLRNAPGRVRGIQAIELLDDAQTIGRGTRFRETRIVFGRPCTETMEITAFDPPRSYSVGGDSCGARFATTFDFRPAPGNGTEVQVTLNMTPVTFFARLMGLFAGPMLKACRKAVSADLADLKAVAERPTEPPAESVAA